MSRFSSGNISEKPPKKTDEQIFVYQIIHDLRHPLDAQKAKLEEIRKIVRKNLKPLASLIRISKQIKQKESAKELFGKLQNIQGVYFDSKQIRNRNLNSKLEYLQKVILDDDFNSPYKADSSQDLSLFDNLRQASPDLKSRDSERLLDQSLRDLLADQSK